MVFTIDIGNTATKVVALKKHEANWVVLEEHRVVGHAPCDIVTLLGEDSEGIAVSSTVGYSDELRESLKPFGRVVYLDHTTPIPIKNLYGTPETLGPDRLAAAIGAHTLCPTTDVLVIDMGTAITYDYVVADRGYVGGNISPGIEMRLKALHDYTARLPLVTQPTTLPTDGYEVGTSTTTAIQNGVLLGVKREVEGYIQDFIKKNNNVSVFLTGGAAFLFDNLPKRRIFAHKFLVHIGLAEIVSTLPNFQAPF